MKLGEFIPSKPDHPTLPLPSREVMAARGYEWTLDALQKREQAIEAEEQDPYRYGYEPPVWYLLDCLYGFPWVPEADAKRVRERLGFAEPCQVVLVNGGNRAGKSEYAAKRCMRILQEKKKARAWAFHSNNQMGVEYHHPLFWKYLPREQRRQVKSETEYLSFTLKNGFSDNKLVLHNASELSFRNYEQDVSTIEGGECDFIWADELCPPEWARALEMRVATRGGKLLLTFTPVAGYTPLVAEFREGATCVFDAAGFLMPLDVEGKPDQARAMRVQDVVRDLFQPPPPEPAFERVPRVERHRSPGKGIVFFHTSDNPYGNPASVAKLAASHGADHLRERFYGIAKKSASSRFKIHDNVHVVTPAEIPANGTNFYVTDPSSARNWFMLWARMSGENLYVYREWPSPTIPVPGVGNPGVWTEFDGKRPDGKPGPAQRKFDFGLLRYKEEIARLEGWDDAKAGGPEDRRAWSEWHGSRERIARRIIDSRFASAPKVDADRPVTLLTEMEDMGMFFETASGADIDEGCQLIVDALAYNDREPLGYLNRPRLYVSAECRNLIHALKTWTGVDGNKGASKDPIDCLRYLFTADLFDTSGAPLPQARQRSY